MDQTDYKTSMEELSYQLSSMEGAIQITPNVTDTSSCPRIILYKNAGYALDQERRWRAELANAKRQKNRSAKFDENRDVDQLSESHGNPWTSKRKRKPERKNFNDRFACLMLAEWFLFKEDEFGSNYLFKLCPKGRHVFVIASKGQTCVYSRAGLCLATLLTRLPGGGLGQSSSQMHRNETMLDCIMIGVPSAEMTHQTFSEGDEMSAEDSDQLMSSKVLIFKVLDLICFRSTYYTREPFYERCTWLESFHKEQIESFESNDVARFEIVPSYACDSATMTTVLSKPLSCDLDGVLFYHCAVKYRKGATPLVGWLKPYMLPEWFPEVTVHPDYLRDMAPDYKDYLTDIQTYKRATAQHRRKQKANDVEDISIADLQ